MSNLRKSFTQSGYDQEAAYFHKEDQRLIAKQRRANLKLVSSQPESSVKDAPAPPVSAMKKAA